jgi:hypothetical protein
MARHSSKSSRELAWGISLPSSFGGTKEYAREAMAERYSDLSSPIVWACGTLGRKMLSLWVLMVSW